MSNGQAESQNGSQIGIGAKVQLELETDTGDREALTCTIVQSAAADFEAGFLDVNAPMGRALRGKFAGQRIPFAMGDIVAIHIVAVTAGDQPADPEAAARRAAALDEARRKAEQTNAEMFASSYGSKWGGYEMPESNTADDT